MVETDHPLIEFAERYSDPTLDYLNAWVAIARADALIEDVKKVSGLVEASEPPSRRWAPWFGAEAFSYYSVGYVTCLEWHAKARLMDLLNFKPEALKEADVTRTINAKMIVQMVAKQATVVQLVSAALKVGSLEAYLSVVARVFQELNLPVTPADWLLGKSKHSSTCWLEENDLGHVRELFQFRHTLVHEIGVSTLGHINIRDAWAPDDARENGQRVLSLMRGVEAALTCFGPRLFPRLLGPDGFPRDEVNQFSAEMKKLETAVDSAVTLFDSDGQATVDLWREASACFATYFDAEEKFIASASMLHWRYFDARTPLRRRVIASRIGFLSDLLGHCAADDPLGASSSEIEEG